MVDTDVRVLAREVLRLAGGAPLPLRADPISPAVYCRDALNHVSIRCETPALREYLLAACNGGTALARAVLAGDAVRLAVQEALDWLANEPGRVTILNTRDALRRALAGEPAPAVPSEETRAAWGVESAEEIATTRACLMRIAADLGIDVSSGEWPAHRLAMRIERKVRGRDE